MSIESPPTPDSGRIPPAPPNSVYSPHVWGSQESTPSPGVEYSQSSTDSSDTVQFFASENPPHPAVLRLIAAEQRRRPDSPPDPAMALPNLPEEGIAPLAHPQPLRLCLPPEEN